MVLFYYKLTMGNIRQDITIINERLKKIYILYRKLSDSQRSEGINGVKVNGSNVPVVNKEVNITIPTKTSNLENDSDFTTNSKLNKEVQDRISADNLKLDKPTTTGDINTYPDIVGINGEGDTAFLPANSFGKVDTVMGVSPDVNKNVDISSVAMNWTNANHRWSALPNKSTDDTYNKVMVLDAYGKAGMKNLDYAVPYKGANKAIDLNTQSLTHEGNLVKREGHFEKKLLNNGSGIASNYVKLTDVCSLSLAYDNSTTGDIVITLPIKTSTKWTTEIDIDQADILSAKLIIASYGIRNLNPKVLTVFGHDKIHSVKFCRKDDSSVIIIKRAEQATTFSYGRVNIPTLYYSVAYSPALETKSNYKIEFLKEEDIKGLTINETVLNKDFDRDSYLLDFNNFTNVPNFAQASNVFKKNGATNWTNASHRWSNLPDKSDDDTYNKIMVLDEDGKVGVKEPEKALFFNKDGIVTGKMATFIDVFETDKDGVFTADFSIVGFKEPPKVIVSTETVEPANVTKAENGTYVSIFKDSITTTGCIGRVKLATSAGLLVGMVSANAGAGVKVTVEAKGLI